MNDAPARTRIRDDLDTTLFVEAAAGTGKTTALVGRLVSLLRSGRATLDRVVAVTFTEKAAGEMKLRLRAEIEQARSAASASPDERACLDGALEQLELARIMTIHAFCADLLHERPIEAGVDPLFEVADEEESTRLLDRAFDAWFQPVLADPPEGVRRILRRRPRRRDEAGPRDQLRRAVANLVEHRDFDAAWRRDPEFDRDAEIDALMAELAELADLADRASWSDDWLAKNLRNLATFVGENRILESVRGARDHDGLESELWRLARRTSGPSKVGWSWKGSPRTSWGEGLERDAVLARRDALKERLDALLAASEADLAACLREELRPAVEAYELLKARAGKLDFLDLLVRARDLVRDDASVRAGFQDRFTHFFVDEFQDTDPVQAELMLLLSASDPGVTDWRDVAAVPGKLFIVGDPKQSIYRFRRADVTTYETVKRQLASRGAVVLQLTTSFRSLPALQGMVNAAFAPAMPGSEDGSQAAYVPLEPFREPVVEQPALVALPVPRPYGDYGSVVNWKIDESCPDAVAAFVAWLVTESGWRVDDPVAGRPVAIQPRHICLLFRRFRSFGADVTRGYVRALEARRIPHVLVGGRSFHDREEVQAIRNALAAIEWPDDELRVYATLRGPLFALGDDALLAYRHRVGGPLHTLRPHEPAQLDGMDAPERAVAEALELLAAFHRRRNHRPIAETIALLLARVRAHAGIAIWPTGEQALANCLRTIDVARRFESRGAPSFRAFVEYLDDQAAHGEAQDAPVVEEGTEGVRIMTVHRAKGLEFPVVVLADPTCNLAGRNPTRHVDPARGVWAEPLCGCVPHDLRDAEALELRHDREESIRLGYVAATRARDLLIVPTIGDLDGRPGERWLEMLEPVVYPSFEQRRESERAPGCPEFGEDSVLERPESCGRGTTASVRPGLVRSEAGDQPVVWWDPSVLDLDVEEEVGLRQQRILQADEGERHSEAGIRAHAEWQARRGEMLARGGIESVRLARVVDLAVERGGAAEGVVLEEVALDRTGRPGGRRFGSLVHAVLAALDLEAGEASVRATARTHGRIVGATEPEIAAAARASQAALAHPLMRRAAAAQRRGDLRRETPVFLRLEDGRLAEGVVDLAFREKTGRGTVWTVVDFKTDVELSTRRAQYEAQVALYADAIATATGDTAAGVLLMV